MTIPLLDNDGKLPSGVWPCAYADLEARFGHTRRRRELLRELRHLLADLERRSISGTVFVNGSFITAEPAPEDVDILLLVPRKVYSVRRLELLAIRRRVDPTLDFLFAPERSVAGREIVKVFSEDRLNRSKGLLRLEGWP